MLSLEQLKEYCNGNIVHGNPNTILNNFCLNKNMYVQGNYFFFPIKFRKVDREIYILNHVKNGCIGFMINKTSPQKDYIESEAIKINPNICILEVDSVDVALFDIGKKQREKNINKPTIAVTGSVGKTTLCSLISKILSTEIKVLHDFNNQNNNTRSHISLAYLLLDDYDMAVTELGISRFRKMPDLSELVQPSIAIINNIGTAHIDNLKTKENILAEKLHITDYLRDKKILFVNSDDEYLKTVEESNNYNLKYYSINEAYNIAEADGKVSFTTKIYGRETDFDLNLYGTFHIRNIILSIKIAEIYNIKYENIVTAINEFQTVYGRFNVLRNDERNITVIDDVYNSCFESVTNGLDIANKMKSVRKIAVLGTIGSGSNGKEDTDKVHEELGSYFSNLNFDYLFLIGDFTKHILKTALNSFVEKNTKRFKTKETLIEDLKKLITDGDLVYIKDAGLQDFEVIIDELRKTYKLL